MTARPPPVRFNGAAVPAAIVSGLGCRAVIAAEAAALGLNRVLLLCSPSLRNSTDFVTEIASALGPRLAAVDDAIPAHTPDTALRAAAARAHLAGIDAVIAIGGGAVLDAAKALAAMLPSGRDIRDLAARFDPATGFRPTVLDVEPLPLMTVPSTFSAAEVMFGGGFTDTVVRHKSIVVHPKLAPKRVFLDGEIVASTPSAVLRNSGLNAVHHCLEALYSRGRQPLTDALALGALAGLFAALPALAPGAPAPEPATFQAAIDASAMSGLTYANSGLGIGHAICHSLGGRYGLSHAAANAVICRHSLRFNIDVAREPMARAARAVGALDMVVALDDLTRRLETPRTLREIGLPARDSFAAIADDVLHDASAFSNPRPAAAADVVALLEAAW